MATDRCRKAVRHRPRIGAPAQRTAARGIRRKRNLPDRPLSRQRDGAKHPGAAFLERHFRAAVEPQLHRLRRDQRDRNPRRRKPGPVLRKRRSAARHDPEPPAAVDGFRRDGAAGRFRTGTDPQRDRQSVPRHPPLHAGRNRAQRAADAKSTGNTSRDTAKRKTSLRIRRPRLSWR